MFNQFNPQFFAFARRVGGARCGAANAPEFNRPSRP